MLCSYLLIQVKEVYNPLPSILGYCTRQTIYRDLALGYNMNTIKKCKICKEEIDTSFMSTAPLTQHLVTHLNKGTIDDWKKLRSLVFKEVSA